MAVLGLVICLHSANGEAEEIIRLSTGEFPPYFSKTLPHSGIALRIVQEAFALEGITVEYHFRPWARAYDEAKDGNWDGTALWGLSADRLEHFYASESVFDTQWVFFHLKGLSFDWEKFDDLKNFKIGATREYTYGDAFYEAESSGKINVEWVSSDTLNYRKLLEKRIHLFPQNIQVGYYELHHQFSSEFSSEEVDQVTHHPRSILTVGNHLLLPKTSELSQTILERFNRGLRRLRESGKTDEYLQSKD